MNNPLLVQEQDLDLQAKIAEATEKIAGLDAELRALDIELENLLGQQKRYQYLEEMCAPLEHLTKMGAADLFREATGHNPEFQIHQIHVVLSAYHKKITHIEQSRTALHADIQQELAEVRLLQARDMPYRVMPWSTHGDDERRFRLIVSGFVLLAIVLGGLIHFFRPPVEESKGVVVPERIARIIKKKQEIKQEEKRMKEQAAKKAAEKAAGKAEGKPEATAEAKHVPSDAETKRSRKVAETKGVLAFKSDLANLLDDAPLPRMGAAAQISVPSGSSSGDSSQRSLIVSRSGSGGGSTGSLLNIQGESGSGGINTSNLTRQGGSGVGQRITSSEIKLARIESAAAEADRPLGKNGRPTRSDEEIQVVFDRYKAALYRMYNRELRVNPKLRGSMQLRIVIEQDGSVSDCTVKSNDLDSPEFTNDIVKRVLAFNFGEKEGVGAITILYPIEFLPPS